MEAHGLPSAKTECQLLAETVYLSYFGRKGPLKRAEISVQCNAKTMSVYYLLSSNAIRFYLQSLISELHGAKRIVRLTPKVMTSPNELTASSFMLVFPVLRAAAGGDVRVRARARDATERSDAHVS